VGKTSHLRQVFAILHAKNYYNQPTSHGVIKNIKSNLLFFRQSVQLILNDNNVTACKKM